MIDKRIMLVPAVAAGILVSTTLAQADDQAPATKQAEATDQAQAADPSEATDQPQAAEQAEASKKKDSGVVQEIVVWGERAAELNARQAARNKDIFSAVIMPDDVGNFADQNVAESLRRLPGVTLQRSEGEGRYTTIRGLGPGFVNVKMDGTELASASDDTRAFALDALPSDILESIEVHKSLTPDMDLNSIGGAVNVKTISAFDRGRDQIKLKLQGSNQRARDESGFKGALSGTHLFAEERVGLGFSLNYENRPTLVDEIRHHSSGEMLFRQQDIPDDTGPEILAPRQVENRQEIADRTRLAGSFNLEMRPTKTARFFVRGGYTSYEDEDVALREYFDFQDAGSGEVAYVNAQTGEFALSDVDVFHQYFIQQGTTTTSLVALGGENVLASHWLADYELSWSRSNWDKPDGRRVQFRESDLVVWGQGFGDDIRGRVMTPEEAAALGGFEVGDFSSSDIRGDASDIGNFHYDNLFLEDSFRQDDLKTLSLNLRRDFSGKLSYVKAGFRMRNRSRDRNKDRWSFDPDDGVEGCNGDASCEELATKSDWEDFAREMPPSGSFTYPFIQRSEAESLIAATRVTRDAATNGEVSIDSTKEDYDLTEDTMAAYFMGEWKPNERTSLIAGARWEATDFSANGYFSIENDDFQFLGDESSRLDIAIPMDTGKNEYSHLFPSLHLRYEPREDVLVRGSIWTSFVRPSFGEARAFAKIDGDVELCVPGTRKDGVPGTGDCDDSPAGGAPADLQSYELARDNSIQIGNPNLDPMTSINFDASIGWYANKKLFVEAAVFYKDIKNFIVPVSSATMALDELPVALPVDQVTQFSIPSNLVLNDVDLTVNGEQAHVYGAELTYSQGFGNGLFFHSNVTLLSSKATLDPSLRVGEIRLPEQANLIANVAAGWENDKLSLRVIGNYRDKILESIGSCGESADPTDPHECHSWGDRYQDSIFNVDFKLNYRVTDKVTLYFDAINLTDERDLRYFVGNDLSRGRALYQLERYGRSFQAGAHVDLNL